MTSLSSRRAMLLLGAGGALSGCGFRPVYAPVGAGIGPAGELAAIEVSPASERPGQILREAILARLRSEPGQPRRYDLSVGFGITGEVQGILNLTQATRIRLVGRAVWILTARDPTKTRLAESAERIVDGYDIYSGQLFGQDLDNEAVQRRMATQLADKVLLALAVWFNKHPPKTG